MEEMFFGFEFIGDGRAELGVSETAVENDTDLGVEGPAAQVLQEALEDQVEGLFWGHLFVGPA